VIYDNSFKDEFKARENYIAKLAKEEKIGRGDVYYMEEKCNLLNARKTPMEQGKTSQLTRELLSTPSAKNMFG
jgi:hypothetical protein